MKESVELQKIQNEDDEAFKNFFITNYPSLFAYVISHTGDKFQAEDITQQAFINFWVNRKKIDPGNSPKSYLYRIAFNLFVDIRRQKKIEYNIMFNLETAAILEDINDSDELRKNIAKLRLAIDSLPERCKTILLLNKMEGLKYNEIAEKLNISVKTVEAQMRIAFQKVRDFFQDNNIVLWMFFGRQEIAY